MPTLLLKHTNNNRQTRPKYIDDINECRICGDEFENNVFENNVFENNVETLKCGHIFHYDCIIYAFKTPGNRSKDCPYCRKYHGYLRLRSDMKPIKHVHKEFNINKKIKKLEQDNKNPEILFGAIKISNKTKSITLQQIDALEEDKSLPTNSVCQGVYKTGPKAGQQCTVITKNGTNYCGRHKTTSQ